MRQESNSPSSPFRRLQSAAAFFKMAATAENGNHKTIALFDVDGTLTVPRKASPQFPTVLALHDTFLNSLPEARTDARTPRFTGPAFELSMHHWTSYLATSRGTNAKDIAT